MPTLERPLVLVLDDLHAVANPACLDALAALFEYVPAGSQIAIASREVPDAAACPLAGARAWCDEIGVADLRLDEQEAGLLLRGRGSRARRERAVRPDRADGGLACRLVPRGAVVAGRRAELGGAAGFTGDDRFVSEYFRLELLSRLPAAEARFLKYTSMLDRMCGGLCDAVLQTTRSADTLETLERTNGFVVPLDRRGEWYRYHHLFGELLRNELERSEPRRGVRAQRLGRWPGASPMT